MILRLRTSCIIRNVSAMNISYAFLIFIILQENLYMHYAMDMVDTVSDITKFPIHLEQDKTIIIYH